MSDRYETHCWCDHNKQLCVPHGLSERERRGLRAQGHEFRDRITGELLDCVHGRPCNANADLDKRRKQALPAYITGDYAGEIARNEAKRAAVLAAALPGIDAAEHERRRAHADTAPQPTSTLATAQMIYDEYYPRAERQSIDLAKLTKDSTSYVFKTSCGQMKMVTGSDGRPGDTYFVDSESGNVSRMTNVSESGEAALAANGIFRMEAVRTEPHAFSDPLDVGSEMEEIAQRMWSAPQPDAVAVNPERLAQAIAAGKIDPLDVEYDGRSLRLLLEWDQAERRETTIGGLSRFTPAQRSAISAHWASELRSKVAAAKQTEREQVVSDYDEDGL